IKEKGRYMFIREKARTIKEKPGKHLPSRAQQAKLERVMREQLISEKRQEKEETKPTEQLEQFGRDSLAYYGEKTHFTVKCISDKPTVQEQMRHSFVESKRTSTPSKSTVIKERKASPVSIKEKADFSVDIKDKSTMAAPIKESKGSPKVRTRTESKPSPAPLSKERQVQLAKKSFAAKTGKNAAAKREATGILKKAIVQTAKRASESLALAAGALLVILMPLTLVFGIAGMMFGEDEHSIGTAPISEEVIELSPYIFAYAHEHEVEEYISLIKAVMMQESGGRGTDPMQASECIYNTKYPNSPGGITDPEYSIDVGIRYFKDCLEMADVQGPDDIDGISLALQSYNFGSGYIPWAIRNYGGHSELSALEFSEMMAKRNGWTSYGDIYYVNHVLRYYGVGETEQV
ncbi:MAG: lysozyme family protein, partial [Akkermansia sp.]|nr:lysozyme family protein [Akkermansia sp.]